MELGNTPKAYLLCNVREIAASVVYCLCNYLVICVTTSLLFSIEKTVMAKSGKGLKGEIPQRILCGLLYYQQCSISCNICKTSDAISFL